VTTIETAEASAIPEPSPRARALHEASLVWDAHMDSLMRVLAGEDLGVRTEGQADLVRWREGGVDVQVFAVWVDTVYGRHHAARRALQQIDGFHRLLEANPDRVGLARSAADIARLRGEGKLAAVLAIEGGIAIQNDLALLRTFHRLGATSMTLTHSASLDWADSSTDAARCGGLSAFGREVIREMHRLRMLVDVSHVSDDCIRAVLDLSDAPIIASHSSCKAISNHPRNLSDAMLRTIAAAGGVVGINFYSQFLDQAYNDEMGRRSVDLLAMLNAPPPLDPDALDAYADERIRTFWSLRLPRPPFERILEHIDHAVQVAGIDHVGIGSDLDSGAVPTPVGLDSVSDYPRITEGLLRRGYAEADVAKVLGENFLRVYRAAVG
jgi:membrane dipeptidase